MQRSRRQRAEGTQTLSFQKETFESRFKRLWRRAVCASNNEDTLPGSSVTGSELERGAFVGLEDPLRTAEDEETSEWVTDLLIHDDKAMSDSHEDKHNTSQQERTVEHVLSSRYEDMPFIGSNSMLRSLFHSVDNFLSPKFATLEMEEAYQKERWSNHKPLALAAAVFLVINWALYIGLNRSVTKFEKWMYYGVGTAVTIPTPFIVAFNGPRKFPLCYQILIGLSIWFWSISETIQTYTCHFFLMQEACKPDKDFLALLAYAIALPALGLFACQQRRSFFLLGCLVQTALFAALVIPRKGAFARNFVSFLFFQGFWCFISFWQESIDRRSYVLRSQLKIAFKAQQRAQVLQKQAASSKKRFVSYIFHEVRVPLNSAMLAFQNLREAEIFNTPDVDIEVHALESSMTAVKQVLDDCLDLDRMDRGRFMAAEEPFPFSTSVTAIFSSLKVSAAAKNLACHLEIDPEIDACAQTLQQSDALYVIGDNMRLRQLLSNLCSNAVKFTQTGGVTVRATLEKSVRSPQIDDEKTVVVDGNNETIGEKRPSLNRTRSLKAFLPDLPPRDSDGTLITENGDITILIEVEDTGPGVRPSEASVLFRPFFQTRLGSTQASNGSGLGLALCKQIVLQFGGRLGIRSRRGQGSTFWFTMPYHVASRGEIDSCKSARPLNSFEGDSRPLTANSLPAESTPRLHRSLHFADSPHLQPHLTPLLNIEPRPVLDKLSHSPILTLSDASTLPITLDSIEENPLLSKSAKPAKEEPIHISSDHHPLPPMPSVKAQSYSAPQPSPPSDRGSAMSTNLPSIPLKVLVVDDDALTRKLLSRMLERLGCQVETAEDGQFALDILMPDNAEPRFFDMISLDNSMPNKSGIETAQILREGGRNDFIVGATGNALKVDQQKFLDAGANRILSKPVLLRDLKEMLALAAERRTTQTQKI